MDETAPETRLVSINRLPQGGQGSQTPSSDRLTPSSSRINLLPTENVLDEQIDPGALSDDSLTSEGFDHMRGKRRGSKQARTKIVVMSSGILCPPVTAQQMTMVEQECGKFTGIGHTDINDLLNLNILVDTGLSRDQLIENAGRVSSMMALQTMGKLYQCLWYIASHNGLIMLQEDLVGAVISQKRHPLWLCLLVTIP